MVRLVRCTTTIDAGSTVIVVVSHMTSVLVHRSSTCLRPGHAFVQDKARQTTLTRIVVVTPRTMSVPKEKIRDLHRRSNFHPQMPNFFR